MRKKESSALKARCMENERGKNAEVTFFTGYVKGYLGQHRPAEKKIVIPPPLFESRLHRTQRNSVGIKTFHVERNF